MNIDNISKRNDAESVKHKQVACRDKSKYKCACGKVYDSRSSLTRHIDSLSMSYTCPHCSKVFVSSKGFNQHLDSKVCRKGISDDDNELILGNKVSSKSSLNDSSHKSQSKSQSRPQSVPSNEKGIVIISLYNKIKLSLS
jgi:uncharacterized C2H2 Zn-finger protein